MSDPLALMPLAAAAREGRVGDHSARELVAAGVTLLQRCAPLVRALQGRRAAILLESGPEFLVALAASDGRGAVFINPLAARPEIEHQLRDANVGAVFTVESLHLQLPYAFPRILLDEAPVRARMLIGGDDKTIDMGSHTGLALEGAMDAPGRDEEAAIVYTSAMEGVPLGAVLTHRNLLANARATVEAAALDESTVSLALLPFSHLFGFTVSLMAPLIAGGRVIVAQHSNPALVHAIIRGSGVTLLAGVPSVFMGLLSKIARNGRKLGPTTLRVCICGGAPLSVELQQRWEDATGVPLRQGYGLTEAGPVCLFNRPSLPNKLGTLGVHFPGVEVAIHNGEICVRGENVFPGYVSGGEHGLQVNDGWLHTGDRGTIDQDGVVTFTGVIKPMFTRNGYNIYPREIERVVRAMPGVSSVTASAFLEPSRENGIALAIVGSVTEEAVKRWCEGRLSRYKQPSTIEIGTA